MSCNKGCLYDSREKLYEWSCVPLHYGEWENCPCRLCLVKVMCNKVCRDRQEYSRIVLDGTTKYEMNPRRKESK